MKKSEELRCRNLYYEKCFKNEVQAILFKIEEDLAKNLMYNLQITSIQRLKLPFFSPLTGN